jgi:hypothetical protein
MDAIFLSEAIAAPLKGRTLPAITKGDLAPNPAIADPHRVQPDDIIKNGTMFHTWADYDVLVRTEIHWLRSQIEEKNKTIEGLERTVEDLSLRLRGADAAADATAEVLRGLTERLGKVLHHTHVITGTAGTTNRTTAWPEGSRGQIHRQHHQSPCAALRCPSRGSRSSHHRRCRFGAHGAERQGPICGRRWARSRARAANGDVAGRAGQGLYLTAILLQYEWSGDGA